jgi:uncharacterized protein
MTVSAGPVTAASRIDLLDVLRGVAIFGILIANMMVVSGYLFLAEAERALLPTAAADDVVAFLVRLLLEGKFYSIFSLLFGYGFAVQLASATARGAEFAPLFRRRLRGLLLIGLAHAVFLWYGDILLLYALLGFLLLRFRSSTDRTLLRVAAACLALPVVIYLIMLAVSLAMGSGAPPPPPVADAGPDPTAEFVAMMTTAWREGSWLDSFRANLFGLAGRWVDLFISVRFPKVFGMFLLGFYLGRRGFGADLDRDRPQLRRALIAGVAIGLPTSAAMAWLEGMEVYFPPSPLGLLQTVVAAIGVPALALAYAAGIALAFGSAQGRWLLGRVAPAGRMALTNYLMHSAIMIVLFYGWGLGWHGGMGPAITTPIALAICAAQVPLSRWWLSRYQFGPVEWFWRQYTYQARLPIRRAAWTGKR